MNKKHIIAIVIVLAIVVYFYFDRKNKKEFLVSWASSDSSQNSKELRIAAINKMTNSEISTLYKIVRDFFNTGTSIPPDLQIFWDGLHLKYGPPF